MKLSVKEEISAYRSELIALRRDFHQYPEPGFKEYRTSKVVYDYLKTLKFDSVRNVSRTGILACLKGLKEQGCDGPVTDAITKIEKHINQAAHE